MSKDTFKLKKGNKTMNLFSFLVIFILIPSYAHADNTPQSRYPVRKGDVLIFERTYDIYDENGKIEVYNGDAKEKDRIKRTITLKRVKVRKIDSGLKYGFPLKIGLRWDCNREEKGRTLNDNSYCSYVENQEDIVVPAGVFEGCFKIVYSTLPDTTTNWYCPGIGVVKSEYIHHGTLTNEIVVLKKIIWN